MKRLPLLCLLALLAAAAPAGRAAVPAPASGPGAAAADGGAGACPPGGCCETPPADLRESPARGGPRPIAAAGDIENYVNELNAEPIYVLPAGDVKAATAVDLTFTGDAEARFRDANGGTHVLFRGRAPGSGYAEETAAGLPVRWDPADGGVVPLIAFLTYVGPDSLSVSGFTLHVIRVVQTPEGPAETEDSVTVDLAGAEPFLTAVPYALCHDLTFAPPARGARAGSGKYRALYAGVPYYLNAYGAACPDSGCPAGAAQPLLKELCASAPYVELPEAGPAADAAAAGVPIAPGDLTGWSLLPSERAPAGAFPARFVLRGAGADRTLAAGFRRGPAGAAVAVTEAGWYSFSSLKPLGITSSSVKKSYFYSPVFTVVPAYLAVAPGDYSANDFHRFRDADGFSFRDSEEGLAKALDGDFYGRVGTATCPLYYNQKIVFSGYLSAYGGDGIRLAAGSGAFARVPAPGTEDYPGAVMIAPLAPAGTGYAEEGSYDPCAGGDSGPCAGYANFVPGRGLPFYAAVAVPGTDAAGARRPEGAETFVYYAKLLNCLADNDGYSFAEETDCAAVSFACPAKGAPCPGSNVSETPETDVPGAAFGSARARYASRARALAKLSIRLGRLVSENVSGTGRESGAGGEPGALYAPLVIKGYTETGWRPVADDCTLLYIRDEGSYASSLEYAAETGVIGRELCPEIFGAGGTACSDAAARFNGGALWLKGTKRSAGNAYVFFSLKKDDPGGSAGIPFFHLGHLYDPNTAKGSITFSSYSGNRRVIERKFAR